MPRQETFHHEVANDVLVGVLKTYDQSYAREVFSSIGEEAKGALVAALDINGNYEPNDIPRPGGTDFDDFLWQALFEAAREDVRQDANLYSFFVVSETEAGKTKDLYISPDWPSAEAFAKARLKKA